MKTKTPKAVIYIPYAISTQMQASLKYQLWTISSDRWEPRVDEIGHTRFECFQNVSYKNLKACRAFIDGFWFALQTEGFR